MRLEMTEMIEIHTYNVVKGLLTSLSSLSLLFVPQSFYKQKWMQDYDNGDNGRYDDNDVIGDNKVII